MLRGWRFCTTRSTMWIWCGSWFGNPLGVYAKTVKSPRTAHLAATKSVIVFDYGDSKRVFITANHSHDFNPKMQRSFVQWEGMEGAMRAQMGVNLNYPDWAAG